jgi:DNA-binding XRE family transcriptional regulator
MTEAELSAALGGSVGPSTISNWERGETQPLYWLRPKLAAAVGVHFHKLFVPEEVAAGLLLGPRRLLLTAHYLRGSHTDLYVETGRGVERTNALWLLKLWLVEDNGNDVRRRSRLWHLTGPGEDVLSVLKEWQ